MHHSDLDLSRLAIERDPAVNAPRKRRRRWLSRYLLPGAILIGFAALLGGSLAQQLSPPRVVSVTPAIVKQAELQAAGTPLFQAAGWVEPSPSPIAVGGLAAGVIEELLVVEGEPVAPQQPIARLIAADAELVVERAEATVDLRASDLQRAQAELRAATLRLKHPVHLNAQVAEAQRALAEAQTELDDLPFQIEAAEAQLTYSRTNVEGKRSAREAIAGRVLQEAERENTQARVALQQLHARRGNLLRQIDALQAKADALQTQADLLIDESRQVEEARAKVASAEALCAEAGLQLEQAHLTLQRMIIRSPIHGRVLRVTAFPGSRVMGLAGGADQNANTVVELYDPTSLQVRADVRLDDVPRVLVGAPVKIDTASSEKSIQGRVLQITSSANIQKNTLGVKVALLDPPPSVSPEMLVTATFMAPERTSTEQTATRTQRVFIPAQLVQSGEEGDFVWIVDASDRTQRRSLTLGQPQADGLVPVEEGMSITDKLISSSTHDLRDGEPVRVRHDDSIIARGK